ncbi:MAG: cobyric acid synthase CobQ, partial [Lachnospiraceae bacterium]|nr:cobyric acid synthase CobQ [Lachnospiraceae bacterium]
AEGGGRARGLGLLPVDTSFGTDKITRQNLGRTGKLPAPFEGLSGMIVNGYEIHMGRTILDEDAVPLISDCKTGPDGCVSGNCMGTYFHGIFDDTDFREALIRLLYVRKGLERKTVSVSYREYKEKTYDGLADILRSGLDMDRIYKMLV